MYAEEDAPGEHEIWIMDANGANKQQLTDDDWDNLEPVLCDDKIYFSSDRDCKGVGSGYYDIFVMSNQGGTPTNLTPGCTGRDASPDCKPGLNPYGIVFESDMDSDKGEIYSVPTNGGTITRLTNNAVVDKQPSWCGTKIVYINRRAEAPPGIHPTQFDEAALMDSDGSNARLLSCDDWPSRDPRCSPDGLHVAMATGDLIGLQPMVKQIWRFPICDPDPSCCPNSLCCFDQGGTSLRLTKVLPQSENLEPAWSPGGTSIVFSSSRLSVNPPDGTTDFDIYRLDAIFGDDPAQNGFLNQLTSGTQLEDSRSPHEAETRPPSP